MDVYSSAEIRWGGPPGPRGSPRTRSAFGIKPRSAREAGQGAGRGPGGPPHTIYHQSDTAALAGAFVTHSSSPRPDSSPPAPAPPAPGIRSRGTPATAARPDP